MADAATSTNLAQTLPSDAVLEALKMIDPSRRTPERSSDGYPGRSSHRTGMLCSIFLLDEDGLHLRYGVAASLPEAYRAATDGICIGPIAGSCGYSRSPSSACLGL